MNIIRYIAGLINEDVNAPTKPATTPKPATPPKRKPKFDPWKSPKPATLPRPKAGGTDAPTKPATTPKPATPKKKPQFDPWRSPKPATLPRPKARRQALDEAFDQDANRSTVDFWRNIRSSDHPFKQHPLLALYGFESASKAFDYGIQKLIEANPQMQNMSQREAIETATQIAFQVVQQARRLEQPHIRELEDLAIRAVADAWGIPQEMLQAHITTRINMPDDDEPDGEMDLWGEEEIEPSDLPATDDLRPHINKRITMNALTQGAAVHNMATLHHLVSRELEEISPQLLSLYSKFSIGATSMYWMMDFASITKAALKSSTVGLATVEYEDENEDEMAPDEDAGYQEEPEDDTEHQLAPRATVIAQGFNFPVVVQELVKGAMEILTRHGLEDLTSDQTDKIWAEADRLEDEPWLIQVGPHLWRSFLKIVPKGSQLSVAVSRLAQQEPKFVHDLLAKTIEAVHRGEDPAEAREELAQLLQRYEAEESDDEEPGFESDADYGEENEFGDDEDHDTY